VAGQILASTHCGVGCLAARGSFGFGRAAPYLTNPGFARVRETNVQIDSQLKL